MKRREIRYITLFDGEYDKQIFSFEVGISLTNEEGKEVRDALFCVLKSEYPDLSDDEIIEAIKIYAYTGMVAIEGKGIMSSDDIVCYTLD